MTSEPAKKARLMGEDKDTMTIGCRVPPKPIVSVEFTEDLPLRHAYIGVLKQKKDISLAIKSITTILPGFAHLKRCSGGRLVLAYVTDANPTTDPSFVSEDVLKDYLTENNFDLGLFSEILSLPVPTRAARTRAQAKKASTSWPVTFHPNLSIESIITGAFFDENQLETIETCMKLCIAASKQATNDHCTGSAVVLNLDDQGISRILAIAASKTDKHPLWHAAMLAVDLVAKAQGGGAWDLKTTDVTHKKRKGGEGEVFCYPMSLTNLEIPVFSKSSGTAASDAYLCTGYWVFLLAEPCALCAMALLHSRVSMIFYGVENKSSGVLGSKALLHTLPGLNHRYKVWSSVLERECMAAMDTVQSGGSI